MTFAELGLSDKVLEAVTTSGYTQPTPIQAQAIPHVLARRDVLGVAQTGTGKTAAFTLPMLTLLESGRARARMPRTLVLEPTRELAAQVVENFERYGANHKLNVALLIGGVSFGDQDMKITRGVDVLIATPGRLLDHFERGKLLLTGVELLVIDEADRMLDMGFIPDIERIVKLVPFTRQTLFFSATMPPEIQGLADAFLHNPVRIEVAKPASTAATITQRLYATGADGHVKRERLRDLIRTAPDFKNAIIFCNRKIEVAALHKSLLRHGFVAAALHGDLDQRARTAALDSFRAGEVPLLIASDVAARGLDIPAVSHVFNYDVPHHAEDYVHRIGRTGRAGRTGHAFTLVAPGDERSLAAIESLIGQPVPWEGLSVAEMPDLPRAERGARRSSERGGSDRGERRGRGGDREKRASAERPRRAEPAPTEDRPRRDEAEAGQVATAERAPERALRPIRSSDPNRGRGRAEPRSPDREAAPRQRSRAAEPKPSSRAAEPAPSGRATDPRPTSRPPRRYEDEAGAGDNVRGLGDHVPAFLMRAPAKRAEPEHS